MQTFTFSTPKKTFLVFDELSKKDLLNLQELVNGEIIRYYHYYYGKDVYQLIVTMKGKQNPKKVIEMVEKYIDFQVFENKQVKKMVLQTCKPRFFYNVFGGKLQSRWTEGGLREELVITLQPGQHPEYIAQAVVDIETAPPVKSNHLNMRSA